ncbi:MAG: O-antigen ligase family protein [Bacteroidales bacterium]
MAAKSKNVKAGGTPFSENLFNLFFIFIIIILPIVYFQRAQDASLMPRLMVLSVFLLGYTSYIYAFHRHSIINLNLVKQPVLILGALYLFISVISLAPALNRSEGLFDITKTGLTLLMVMYAAQLFSVTPGWYARLSNLAVIAALIALLIGVYQFFTRVPGHQEEHLANGRDIINVVKGLMGNKNEYASYLMLLLPFTMYGTVSGKGNWRLAAVTATVLVFIMLILVSTRATWVGIFISGFVITVIAIINHKKLEFNGRKVKIIVIVASSVVILLAAGLLEGGKFTHSKYMEKLGSIIRPEADNNHFRLDMWKITAEMAMDHPVTGVGAGNWQIAIPEYYPRIGLKDKEVNWISPHNDYLWILAEKGFPGLVLYLCLIMAAIWLFIRLLHSNPEKERLRQALFILAGLIGYLTVACFDFPYQRIDHQVIFAILVGGLIALSKPSIPASQENAKRHFFFIPVLLFLGFGTVYGFQALKVETHIKKSTALRNSGNMAASLAEVDAARTPWRNLDASGSPVDYYAGLAHAAMNDNKAAIQSYTTALSVHPNHVALLSNLGKSYYAIGYYGLAEHYYLRALQIVPGFKEARVNLSTLYYVKARYKESYDMLKGIKGGGRIPEVKQNRRALEKLLGYPADSLKVKKHKDKNHKKDHKKKRGV